MLKSTLRPTALLAVALIPPASVAAAHVSAGGCRRRHRRSQGKQGGFYRAIVVMTGSEQFRGARLSAVAGTFGNRPFPHDRCDGSAQGSQRSEALQCFDRDRGEQSKDNEITIIVSSYDFEADKDITLYVKGTAPGKYAMAKAPAKSPAVPPAAAPTNVPKDD
jgi:hypothetical protein